MDHSKNIWAERASTNPSLPTALGAQTLHIGCLGPDSDWLRDQIANFGLSLEGLASVDTPLGHAVIFVSDTAEIAAHNAIVLAERVRQSIPVAKGASKPLVQSPNPIADFVHGKEGFGTIPAQPTSTGPVAEPAYEFIFQHISVDCLILGRQ